MLVDLWQEKHRVRQVQSRLDLMPQTRSLKEERVKIGQIIKANPKQVKQGTVFSCGIRLTLLKGSDRQLVLAKGSKKPSAGSVSQINGPFRKGTSFSRMLLLGPFRTTHSYFDNSVSICPTSVSYYKWTLSMHTSVHAKH